MKNKSQQKKHQGGSNLTNLVNEKKLSRYSFCELSKMKKSDLVHKIMQYYAGHECVRKHFIDIKLELAFYKRRCDQLKAQNLAYKKSSDAKSFSSQREKWIRKT